MAKLVIGVLHSGDLAKVSLGGVSEYVRQFTSTSKEPTHLFGVTRHGSTDASVATFTSVCTDKRHPLTVWYVLRLFLLMLTHGTYFRRIDIFYAQRMEFVFPFILLFRRKPIVFAIHGSGAYSEQFWGSVKARVYHWLESRAIHRATAVFVLNKHPDFGVNYYTEKYPRFRGKFEYHKVPVENEVFVAAANLRDNSRQDNHSPVVIYYGRLEENPKRVMYLPDILREVRMSTPQARMVVVGDGNDRERLIERFSELGLAEHVTFYPYITERPELARLVASADVSLVLSTFEGICMAALESLSANVPVVATNVGEIPYYLTNGKNGFIISATKPDEIIKEFASAIQEVIKRADICATPVMDYDATCVVNETVSALMTFVSNRVLV